VTQAGEHNPYNPSPVYCISPQPCTLSLSLSLSLSLEPKERKKKCRFLPTKVGHITAASLLEMWPLRFWSEGRKFYFRWSVSKPKLKPERGSVPPTPIPSRREAGRVGPKPPTTASAPEQHDGPCRGCHPNLEAPNQRCPGCNHLQRSRTGSARCAASCCTSPLYLHAATPFAFGALTGVCLTLAYRSVHCVDRNSRTCLA